MLTPHIAVSPGWSYGYGVAVRPDYHGVSMAHHTGGLKGVSSIFVVVPKKHLGGVALANADQVPSDLLLMGAINQRLGLPMGTPLFDVPSPIPAQVALRAYAGWYCSGEGIWLHVTALRNWLRFDFHGIETIQRGLRFRPTGNDGFVVRHKGQKAYTRFERDPRGRLWAVFLGWRLLRRRDPRELPRARTGSMVW
jgi:hypothetical protein